jgi:hypothetical protein
VSVILSVLRGHTIFLNCLFHCFASSRTASVQHANHSRRKSLHLPFPSHHTPIYMQINTIAK